jgi:hypothetical protein
MRVGITLHSKAVLREPQVIIENLGGSRNPKMLNLLYCSDKPIESRVDFQVQATGSRRVRPNMQQFQAL